MRTLLLSTLVASASAFSGTAPSSSLSPPPCVPLPDSDLQLAHKKCWSDFGNGRDAYAS